ncbi:hypothetical protein CVN76_01390, partial [Bacillus sp. mrc49]
EHPAERAAEDLVIPACEGTASSELVRSAMQAVEQGGKRLFVFEVETETVLQEELAGVFGVFLREGESG